MFALNLRTSLCRCDCLQLKGGPSDRKGPVLHQIVYRSQLDTQIRALQPMRQVLPRLHLESNLTSRLNMIIRQRKALHLTKDKCSILEVVRNVVYNFSLAVCSSIYLHIETCHLQ